jgi:hypothetical protein
VQKLNKYPEALLLSLLNFIFIAITHNYKKSNITPTAEVSINTYTIQINQPTRCKNYSSLLLDLYIQFMVKISWTDYVRNEKVLPRDREISYIKYVNGRRTGLVTFYAKTAFYYGLLKKRYKGG